jgi:hypothetical protein
MSLLNGPVATLFDDFALPDEAQRLSLTPGSVALRSWHFGALSGADVGRCRPSLLRPSFDWAKAVQRRKNQQAAMRHAAYSSGEK